jgi:hypothetical protein
MSHILEGNNVMICFSFASVLFLHSGESQKVQIQSRQQKISENFVISKKFEFSYHDENVIGM